MDTCEKEGCKYKARARGLCRRHGNERRGTPCSVGDCGKPVLARGYCPMHYLRWRTHGDVGGVAPLRRGQRVCRVDVCANDAITKDDLCPTHRRRKRLYGDPGGTLSTATPCAICGEPSLHGMRFIDRCETHAWDRILDLYLAGEVAGTQNDGYVYLTVRKKRRPAHRLVVERKLGRPMYDFETVHHLNGRRDDNRPENLELWVVAQRPGQRLDDVLRHYVGHYRKEIEALLAQH